MLMTTLNTPQDDKMQISKGSINFLLSKNTNTAKSIHSTDATGNVIIESFVLHDSQKFFIQEIDDKTFYDTKIDALSFTPDSCVKRIGNYVFQKSTVKNISIPDNIEEFGENWCYEALSLKNIIINPEHKFFQLTNGLLTTKDGHVILFANRDLSGPVALSINVIKILPYSFYSCKQITSFSLNQSNIDYIGPYSFYGCENLKILIISSQGQKLTLGEKCFAFCKSLLNISISCDSLILERFCFECCTAITDLSFSVKKISIGPNTFSGCTNLHLLSIPNAEFIEIKDRSFISLYKLEKIFFNTEQYKISKKAFEDCTSIKEIYLKANDEINSETVGFFNSLIDINLTSFTSLQIENYSFSNMNDLKTVTLRSKNLCLKVNSFENQENISTIIIECENQISFTHEYFESCKALKTFKCTKSKYFNCSEKIDFAENCFANHENLEEVEIVANEINLGNGCFRGSKSLQKVVLHGKNITVGENCFAECDSLKSFIITKLLKPVSIIKENPETNNSSSFISLGKNCFSGLKNLQEVVLHGNNIIIDEKCFAECDSFKSLIIKELNKTDVIKDNSNNLQSLEEIKIIVDEISFCNGCFSGSKSIQKLDINCKNVNIGENCFENDINLSNNCFNCSKKLQKVALHVKNIIINENCFIECNSLKSFILTEIEENNILNEIKLPEKLLFKSESLEEIEFTANNINLGPYCFSGSKKLQKVALHGKNLIIEESCFSECNLLKSFILTEIEENNILNKIKLPEKCLFKSENLEEIEFTANEIDLSNNCFSCSKKLQKVALHGKNISISESCFNECISLKSLILTEIEENNILNEIKLPEKCLFKSESLEEIEFIANNINLGPNCFSCSKKLQKVALHGKNISIGESCFNECISLKSLTLTEIEENNILNEIKLPEKCLFKSESLEEIEFAANNINLGPNCFSGSQKLQKVVLHGKNISIESNCFTMCDSLKTFIISKLESKLIPERINLEDQCFFNSKIEEIEISSNEIYFHRNSFSGSGKLRNIVLHGKIIIISDECFTECHSLKSFIISDSLEKIYFGDQCFSNLRNLEIVEIKATEIGFNNGCFSNSTNLKKVVLHCKSILIDKKCFSNCKKLETLQIEGLESDSIVDEINLINECFLDSNGIKEIELKANKIKVGDNCFTNAEKLQNVLIDGTSVNMKNKCFNNCISLKSFTVNASLSISIGSQQFIQCNRLNTININVIKHNFHSIICNDSFIGANNLRVFSISGGNLKNSNELLNSSSLSTLDIESANEIVIDSDTFNESKLKEININSRSLIINSNCFNNNSKLQNITFNCPCIQIDSNCFNYVNNCKQLVFKDCNKLTFKSNVFSNLKNLNTIDIKTSKKIDIGPNSFNQLDKVKTITLFSKNIKIGNESFQKCSSLKTVNFNPFISTCEDISKSFVPKKVRIEIKKKIYLLNSDLKKIRWKNIFIGAESFNLCKNLDELNIDAINEIYIGEKKFL